MEKNEKVFKEEIDRTEIDNSRKGVRTEVRFVYKRQITGLV